MSDAPPASAAAPRTIRPAQKRLIGIVLTLAAAVFVYQWLVLHQLEQTSALFIGVPALLAIGVSLLPPAKTYTGILLKVTVLALLLSSVVLGEGFVCILMTAPLYLLIACGIGYALDKYKKKTVQISAAVLLFPMSLEGVVDATSFSRAESVSVTREIALAPGEIESRLTARPRFTHPLPVFLRLGFPRPVEVRGDARRTGSRLIVHFAGGEGAPGDLILAVRERIPGRAVFTAVEDTSHIAHWLTWRTARVEWTALDAGHTRVTWTLVYDRELDPAWYFRPLERYAVSLTGHYLLSAYFE